MKTIFIALSIFFLFSAAHADRPNRNVVKISDKRATDSPPKLNCKFSGVYNNVNGVFKKVKRPTWPGFFKESLINYKNEILVQIDTKRKVINVGDFSAYVLLSYDTSHIRGYFLNTWATSPYLEAFIIDTTTSPFEATYFDGITGNIILGTCEKS